MLILVCSVHQKADFDCGAALGLFLAGTARSLALQIPQFQTLLHSIYASRQCYDSDEHVLKCSDSDIK